MANTTADIVFKNGLIVTPAGTIEGGVAVLDGKIAAVGRDSFLPAAEREIDLTGKYLLPGVIDPECHLGSHRPLTDDFYSETRAAAACGVTTWGMQLVSLAITGGADKVNGPADIPSFTKAMPLYYELLHKVRLTEAADRRLKTFSGGMRKRLDLASSLVSDPKILFLDEPTTGLDPQSRQDVWDYVKQLNKDGMTIFLTTQYMEEADRLADRLCIVDQGKIVAEGTPDELKTKVGADKITLWFKADDPTACEKAEKALSNLQGAEEVGKCIVGLTTEEGLTIMAKNGSAVVTQVGSVIVPVR